MTTEALYRMFKFNGACLILTKIETKVDKNLPELTGLMMAL